MALITCPECGRQISNQADICIGCGIPMDKITKILNTVSETWTPETECDSSTRIIPFPLEDRTISCIRCKTRYSLSEKQCPKCKTPALYLFRDPQQQELLSLFRKKQSKEDNLKIIANKDDNVVIQFRLNGDIKNPINKLICTIKAVGIKSMNL